MNDKLRADMKWEEDHIATMKQIIGPRLMVKSPLEVDRKEAADLLVLEGKNMKVGCRVRRPGAFERFPNDFTIRSRRDSGARTELSKILAGWADWLFYGHGFSENHERYGDIHAWMIVDLKVFRRVLAGHGSNILLGRPGVNIRCCEIPNDGDGTHFACYDVTSFPKKMMPPLLVDRLDPACLTT